MSTKTQSQLEQEDHNVIDEQRKSRLRLEFLRDLESRTSEIEEIVSFYRHQPCVVSKRKEWIPGWFNVCIPVTTTLSAERYMFRCPFPFMVGTKDDAHHDDPVAEKMRCEAATYAWITENCPRVPIPRLLGFGLPDGLRFIPVAESSLFVRAIEYCKDYFARFFGRCRRVPFLPVRMRSTLPSGYFLITYVETGRMLHGLPLPSSQEHKRNLYTGLARIMLDLAKPRLPCIGSFTIKNSGELCLGNRPLTRILAFLESEGIPTAIRQDTLYNHTEPYFGDLLRCLDLSLKHQPNAIQDTDDGINQMAVLTILRAVMRDFMRDDHRQGPFVMACTDLNEGNIFVDTEYNITSIVDLEWCCSLPIETLHPPFWLTGCGADEFQTDVAKEALKREWDLFMDVLAQEDFDRDDGIAQIVKLSVQESIPWYIQCLTNRAAVYNIFLEHIRPIYVKGCNAAVYHLAKDEQLTSDYWGHDRQEFIETKLQHYQIYCQELRSTNHTTT